MQPRRGRGVCACGGVHAPPSHVGHVVPAPIAEMPLRVPFDTPRRSRHTALDARSHCRHPACLADLGTRVEGVRIKISGGTALDARAIGRASLAGTIGAAAVESVVAVANVSAVVVSARVSAAMGSAHESCGACRAITNCKLLIGGEGFLYLAHHRVMVAWVTAW